MKHTHHRYALLCAVLLTAFLLSGCKGISNVQQGDNSRIIQINANSVNYNTENEKAATTPTPTPTQAPTATVQLHGPQNGVYQYVQLGQYAQQDRFPEGILWRVLSCRNDRALLLSEYVLDARPFDAGSADWGGSQLRSWLNSDFYSSAFGNDPNHSAILYSDGDLVFLPSLGDYTDPAYGFRAQSSTADMARAAQGTRYAVTNGLYVQGDGGCSYYMCTAIDSTTVYQVRSSGKIGAAKCDRDNVGVRPAIWIDLKQAVLDMGSGTWNDPFRSSQAQ